MDFEVLKKRSKNLAYEVANLTRCEDEPIQFCGAIQPAGVLLIVSFDDLVIRGASQNWSYFLPGMSAHTMLGKSLHDFIVIEEQYTEVRDLPEALSNGLVKLGIKDYKDKVFSSSYKSKNFLVIDFEFEPNRNESDSTTALKEYVHNLKFSESLEAACQHTANTIKKISGFDRIMIYRFDADWNGEVIAEAKIDRLDSFLHLRYPSTDIPPQARELFFKNQSRMIVDVESTAVPILTQGFHPAEIDLTHSIFRAVSPIHLQYLSNMGVSSSFSAPIRVSDRLWGLIACHHYSGPMHSSQEVRSAFELTAQILSGKVSDLVSRRRLQIKNQTLVFTQNLLGKVAAGKNPLDSFNETSETLMALTESTGAYIRISGREVRMGQLPDASTMAVLLEKLGKIDSLSVWKSSALSKDLGVAPDPKIAGALAVPLSLGFEDILVWFRSEEVQEVRWGGKPVHKESSHQNTLERLSPRSSFAEWREKLENHSRPWTEGDEECAQYFLFSFIQGIFSRAQALTSAYQELERTAKAKDEFISTVSHELRTPLGVILGWIDILQDYPHPHPEGRKAIEVIERNARTQINLINDLLDVSRIISGKLRLNPQPQVNLSGVISDVVESLKVTAAAKAIQLEWQPSLAAELTADRDRLRQILWNLLTNALKFTPKGGRVNIELRKERSSYQVGIRDNGLGIDPEKLHGIFDRFAQARPSAASMGGLGLGLSIVKSLVELHGGHITAESEGEGKGAAFTVTLPIFALQAEKAIEPANFVAQPNLKSSRLASLNILLAEDQPDSLKALSYLIERNGGYVTGVSNGREALLKLRSEKFDLILSDISMPEVDGYELIESWRTEEKKFDIPMIPAIALTAFASSKERAKALQAGFQSHIAKPFEKEEFFAVIESLGIKT